ncbi:hypothetical protein [Edaphobacter aggregans]|uniref:hypothetical protein n=1 Tax=Edaphobacter aggregans TaxID=570835 RepID=UPI0011CFB5FA|nr:hypothetical protein [Edaphobacter aggregans]
MGELSLHKFGSLLHFWSCFRRIRHGLRRVDMAAAMDAFGCVEIGHRAGVIPLYCVDQSVEPYPVGSVPELLIIEVGENGVQRKDLIVLSCPLITRKTRRELEFFWVVCLWKASLWRHMVYCRGGIEATTEVAKWVLI